MKLPPAPVREPDHPRLTRVMLRCELIAMGYTDRAIADRVRGGLWARVRYGAYVDGAAWRSLDDSGRHEVLCRAVTRQSRTEVVVSHQSGLTIWEAPTWGLDLASVDLTRLDGHAGRREAGVRQHRGVIVAGDVVEVHGLAVMHPTRLALETTMVTSQEVGLVVVNDLLHRRLTTPERLWERYGRGMERWNGSLGTDLVLRLADQRVESVGESRTLYMLWAHAPELPKPQCNYEITDADGGVLYRVDFAWPELGLFIEFDGREKYLRHRRPGESVADAVLREKRRQEQIEELTGWRCIRLIWSDLARPHHTVSRILNKLAVVR